MTQALVKALAAQKINSKDCLITMFHQIYTVMHDNACDSLGRRLHPGLPQHPIIPGLEKVTHKYLDQSGRCCFDVSYKSITVKVVRVIPYDADLFPDDVCDAVWEVGDSKIPRFF